jgi:hypothetical protein
MVNQSARPDTTSTRVAGASHKSDRLSLSDLPWSAFHGIDRLKCGHAAQKADFFCPVERGLGQVR